MRIGSGRGRRGGSATPAELYLPMTFTQRRNSWVRSRRLDKLTALVMRPGWIRINPLVNEPDPRLPGEVLLRGITEGI